MELTWSIVSDGTMVPSQEPSQLIHVLDSVFGEGPQGSDFTQRPWFPLLERAFLRWDELGGVSFRYEPLDDGAPHRDSPGVIGLRGDIRLAGGVLDGVGGIVASSSYPDAADILLDTADFWRLGNPAADYLTLRNTLMHEIGHTLGLGHIVSDDAPILMEPTLQLKFDGPQLDDIRGLHYLYGDRFETVAGGNDTRDTATPLGTLFHGMVVRVGSDAVNALVSWNQTDFVSIDSRDDRDFYSFTIAQPGWVDVMLEPLGGVSLQGEPGQPQFYLNASASNNLDLALLGPDSLRISAPGRRAGELETINSQWLSSAGTYYVEIAGSRDTVQLYQLQIGFTAAVNEPMYAMLLIAGAISLKLHRLHACS